MVSTFSRTSLEAFSMSAVILNCTTTMPTLSRAKLITRSTPLMATTASSTGLTIWRSTSAGGAPG